MARPPQGALPPVRVDRIKTCPSLLRVFVKAGSHHADTEFSTTYLPTRDEAQIYTWRDSTLREILHLVRDADPSLRTSTLPLARYSIRIVFWDSNADRYTSSEIAVINNRDLFQSQTGRGGHGNVPPNPRLDRTLADAKFVVGDFLDIAYILAEPIVPPSIGGTPATGVPGPAARPGLGGPGRANGFPGATGVHGGMNGGGAASVGRRDDSTWAAPSAGGRPPPHLAGPRVPPPRGAGPQWGPPSRNGPPGRNLPPPQDQGWGPRRGSATGGRPFEDRDRVSFGSSAPSLKPVSFARPPATERRRLGPRRFSPPVALAPSQAFVFSSQPETAHW
ncbi:hypothetical protein BMF94_0728 [Rhodotorula taiwanensis]|uniref:Histone deacetylase complex subunit SAP18 n=1 Tax=Rhodotorula taiwanensis TaxID=741276 RepID=A0A2S5BGX1_9BASI|nr:hypothetical protein BMF94_0728 [Rhodotorula taiwanensis]